jgi:hypothetical protein
MARGPSDKDLRKLRLHDSVRSRCRMIQQSAACGQQETRQPGAKDGNRRVDIAGTQRALPRACDPASGPPAFVGERAAEPDNQHPTMARGRTSASVGLSPPGIVGGADDRSLARQADSTDSAERQGQGRQAVRAGGDSGAEGEHLSRRDPQGRAASKGIKQEVTRQKHRSLRRCGGMGCCWPCKDHRFDVSRTAPRQYLPIRSRRASGIELGATSGQLRTVPRSEI